MLDCNDKTFKALVLSQVAGATHAAEAVLSSQELTEGELELQVSHSTLNYKDALAITGQSSIVRSWPMVPGIDCAGVVRQSRHARWRAGDPVVVTGWGLGETRWGGLAQRCRIDGDWALPPPASFTAYDCMAAGTAGVTAALAAIALEDHAALRYRARVLVTGAAGGVGSIAVAVLAHLGYDVVASTGRLHEADYLKRLGARSVISREILHRESRPLEKEQWDAVVDTVGGATLATACAATRWNGAVAACGLAGGSSFPVTVMPFILRGVTLYGINSVFVDNKIRTRAWSLLETAIDRTLLRDVAAAIKLEDAIAFAPKILAGAVRGRTVVCI